MSSSQLLRISTAGSVDDGKSTLIGRLMHDCHAIMEDQLLQIKSKTNPSEVDLAAFTDGLKSEREQGITIDVAYKYFSTPKRKYILADTPGHVQYTRNMATGASTADVAIILIDCVQGLTQQTRRHTKISSMLGIPHLIFAVNKIDRCDYSEEVFRSIEKDIEDLAGQVGVSEWLSIPVSALVGDQVTTRSERLSWFNGPSLLEVLENISNKQDEDAPPRFSVQYVIRPNQDFRGFAGRLVSGSLKPGDKVKIYPAQIQSRIKAIYRGGEKIDEALSGHSLVITLEDEVDCDRGSLLVKPDQDLSYSNEWDADLIWFDDKPSENGKTYLLKNRERNIPAEIVKISAKYDLDSFALEETTELKLNDIGKIRVQSHQPLAADTYALSRSTGSFILIDPDSHGTVGAGFFNKSLEAAHSLGREPAIWHFSQDKEYLEKIQTQNRYRSLLIWDEAETPLGPEDVWWLNQLAKSQIKLLTNRKSFLEFKHQEVVWSGDASTDPNTQKEPPYETGL